MAISRLPFWGPTSAQIPCFLATIPLHSLGVPKKTEQNKNWLPHLCLPGGPEEGGIGITSAFSGLPRKEDKIESGSLTLALSGAHNWIHSRCNGGILGGPKKRGQVHNWLLHPCLLGGPQVGGSARQPLNSRGSPNRGTKSITLAVLGAHKIRNGYLSSSLVGGPQVGGMLCNPCTLGGPQTRGQSQKWLLHPCLLRGPQVGGSAAQPLHSRGSPDKGTKSEVDALPLPSCGPTK